MLDCSIPSSRSGVGGMWYLECTWQNIIPKRQNSFLWHSSFICTGRGGGWIWENSNTGVLTSCLNWSNPRNWPWQRQSLEHLALCIFTTQSYPQPTNSVQWCQSWLCCKLWVSQGPWCNREASKRNVYLLTPPHDHPQWMCTTLWLV